MPARGTKGVATMAKCTVRFGVLWGAVLAAGITLALPAAARGAEPAKAGKVDEKVITTASGLQYVDVKVGTGAEAKAGQTVTVNYTGKFEDGKVFDSSVGKRPFEFPLGAGRVIKG
ncbi:MAG: hypothetical protein B7Z68_08230, partial [Acidobacteria bacterium 21-70-11]